MSAKTPRSEPTRAEDAAAEGSPPEPNDPFLEWLASTDVESLFRLAAIRVHRKADQPASPDRVADVCAELRSLVWEKRELQKRLAELLRAGEHKHAANSLALAYRHKLADDRRRSGVSWYKRRFTQALQEASLELPPPRNLSYQCTFFSFVPCPERVRHLLQQTGSSTFASWKTPGEETLRAAVDRRTKPGILAAAEHFWQEAVTRLGRHAMVSTYDLTGFLFAHHKALSEVGMQASSGRMAPTSEEKLILDDGAKRVARQLSRDECWLAMNWHDRVWPRIARGLGLKERRSRDRMKSLEARLLEEAVAIARGIPSADETEVVERIVEYAKRRVRVRSSSQQAGPLGVPGESQK
jgi:hypothetical protein